MRPHMRGGANRCGPLRLAPPRLRKRRIPLSGAGSSQQGPEEEGAPVSPKVHLRLAGLGQRQEPKVGRSRLRHMLGRVRGWGRAQGFAAVRPHLPCLLHRHVAWLPLLVPLLSTDPGGG
jgi:hypothetical protein